MRLSVDLGFTNHCYNDQEDACLCPPGEVNAHLSVLDTVRFAAGDLLRRMGELRELMNHDQKHKLFWNVVAVRFPIQVIHIFSYFEFSICWITAATSRQV